MLIVGVWWLEIGSYSGSKCTILRWRNGSFGIDITIYETSTLKFLVFYIVHQSFFLVFSICFFERSYYPQVNDVSTLGVFSKLNFEITIH
jgi:hypothetical protein